MRTASDSVGSVEHRDHAIPGWHELTWDHVVDFLGRWEPPEDVDLLIDTGDDPDLTALVDRIVTRAAG